MNDRLSDSTADVRARRMRNLIDAAAVAIAIGVVVALQIAYFQRGVLPGDAIPYLAAGERLNAGHQLYALLPGDRPLQMEPPYWIVPLLSPPPIAVLWRPLALIPSDYGIYLWWAFHIAAVLTGVGLMMRRRPVIVSLAVIALSIPLVYELGVANLNGFVLLGLILTWRATALGDERATGVLAGLLAAFKVTPAILGWWLLVQRRWSAIRWAIVAGGIVLAVSIVGAGIEAHLTYLGIIRDTSAVGARPLSLAGMAKFIGVDPGLANLLPTAALVAGVAGIGLLRNRPDWGYVVAVLTLLFGAPTVSINWFIYLLACLAPLAWPWDPGSAARRADRSAPIQPEGIGVAARPSSA